VTQIRRLAAILAADVVGYSRLMGAMLPTTPRRNLFAKVDLPPSQGVRLYEPVDALRATVVYWRCVLSRCRRTMKQRITTLFASGVLALALFGVARAGPFEDAQAADQKGDYATELQILRPLAEQGNALAELGLGVMYANGQGVPQDFAQAVVWCLKAAEQGDADAQTIVGVMYVNGHGVPQDYAQALIWYRKAADQGNGQAQFGLGLMYANGHGVPKDYVRAHMWFSIAAAAGASDVSVREAVKWRDLVATRMTPAQIAEARRLAAEWKPTK